MPVERLDPSQVMGESPEAVAAFIESDYKVRSGLCPNDCGLLTIVEDGRIQECQKCGYFTNKMPDKDTSQ